VPPRHRPPVAQHPFPAPARRYSEQSRTKCIGMTIETRPDFCLTPHLGQMLSYGCTRLEIGLQSTYEDVARDTNRGHTVAAVSGGWGAVGREACVLGSAGNGDGVGGAGQGGMCVT
jgi:hypothetical protein